jgi:hypothetical protein
MKNLFDRLDVLGEDVKQKYIANLTNCNPPEVAALGYAEWVLFDTRKDHNMGGGFVYSKAPEGDDFWYSQQAKFELLNDETYDN